MAYIVKISFSLLSEKFLVFLKTPSMFDEGICYSQISTLCSVLQYIALACLCNEFFMILLPQTSSIVSELK